MTAYTETRSQLGLIENSLKTLKVSKVRMQDLSELHFTILNNLKKNQAVKVSPGGSSRGRSVFALGFRVPTTCGYKKFASGKN